MGEAPIIRVRLHRYSQRPIGLIWRCGQRSGEVSSGTTDPKQAERAAGRLEEQLEAGQIPGRPEGLSITWADFRARYELEWLEALSYGSQKGWQQAANHFEKLCDPTMLMDVSKSMLSKFRGELEAMDIAPASARSHYRSLRAGLGWAESVDLIGSVPTIRQRRRAHGTRTPHWDRVPTLEEFERMLKVASEVRPADHRELRAFMRGLWLTGLRIDELNRLRWETSALMHVNLESKTPLIVVLKQKSGRDRFLPAPPQFWAMIDRPGVVRRGPVFPVRGRYKGTQMTTGSIGGAIGRKAGVVVDPATGKCATAHDLRAAYLSRVAAVATMSQTQILARHSDPKTTSQYYVRHEAEALAKAMGWKGRCNLCAARAR